MAHYNLFKGGKKIEGMNFTPAEISHLRKSGYTAKMGIRLVKKRGSK